MKKKISMLLAVVLIISAMCMTGASAATATTSTTATATTSIGSGVLTVKYNGEAVTFPDAQPFVDENNRTLIPVRFVAETMGAAVSWNQDSQSAVIKQNGITVMVPIGNDVISVTKDGSTSTVKMDTQAVLANSRTYVPIRYVAEALGAWVGYSNLFSTVQIYRDVLTPAEITRLHSYYDMTYEEFCKKNSQSSGGITDASVLEMFPEMAYFSGMNGFANANEFKLRTPNGSADSWINPIAYKGKLSGDTFTYGTQPDIDFAKMILDEAYGAASDLNAQGKATISLRTDLSCIYWSRHSNTSGTYVRGVLTVTIPADSDINWIKSNYDFISNPKAGETRDIDVEIYVNTFTSDAHWSSLLSLQ